MYWLLLQHIDSEIRFCVGSNPVCGVLGFLMLSAMTLVRNKANTIFHFPVNHFMKKIHYYYYHSHVLFLISKINTTILKHHRNPINANLGLSLQEIH